MAKAKKPKAKAEEQTTEVDVSENTTVEEAEIVTNADAENTESETATDTQSVDEQVEVVKTDIEETADDLGELTHLLVRSLRERFRRAGRTFTREPQVVAKADLTHEQLEALKAEPHLAVTEVKDPAIDDNQAN